MNGISMLVRKAANIATHVTHHVAGPTRRVATELGLAIAHQLSGSSDVAVDRYGCVGVTTVIALHLNHCS